MPLRDNRIVCLNHPELQLTPHAGSLVLPATGGSAQAREISDSRGIQLALYTCMGCGYVELYRDEPGTLGDVSALISGAGDHT